MTNLSLDRLEAGSCVLAVDTWLTAGDELWLSASVAPVFTSHKHTHTDITAFPRPSFTKHDPRQVSIGNLCGLLKAKLLTGQMLFLMTNQQRQSSVSKMRSQIIIIYNFHINVKVFCRHK